jgi:hypothetical protein
MKIYFQTTHKQHLNQNTTKYNLADYKTEDIKKQA